MFSRLLDNLTLDSHNPSPSEGGSLFNHLKEHNTFLDLHDFGSQIEMGLGCSIINNPFVNFLKANPEITRVDVSNHPELNDLLFSRFRKHLPFLSEIILINTKPKVDGKQLLKYFAHGIIIKMDYNSTLHFNQEVEKYLDDNLENNTGYEQHIIGEFKKNLIYDFEEFHDLFATFTNYLLDNKADQIIEFKDNANKRVWAERAEESRQERLKNERDQQELVASWESGSFAPESAYINGPKSFAEWPKGGGMEKEIYILYLVVTELKLWEKMKLDPGDGGYMFSPLDYVDQINMHPAVMACGHSGASFGISLRNIQYIAQNGWEKYKNGRTK